MMYSFPPKVEWEQGMFTPGPSVTVQGVGWMALALHIIPKRGKYMYKIVSRPG